MEIRKSTYSVQKYSFDSFLHRIFFRMGMFFIALASWSLHKIIKDTLLNHDLAMTELAFNIEKQKFGAPVSDVYRDAVIQDYKEKLLKSLSNDVIIRAKYESIEYDNYILQFYHLRKK